MTILVLTGPRYVGKSSIARTICESDSRFSIVKTFTTEDSQRIDNFDYQHISYNEFMRKKDQSYFIITGSSNDSYYGIACDELSTVINANKIPILIMDSAIIKAMNKIDGNNYIKFFIDASDQQIADRYKKQYNEKISEEIKRTIIVDRDNKDDADYCITNNKLEDSAELIVNLINYYHCGGALSEHLIRLLIACGTLLQNADLDSINGASYDLHLADEYYYGGKIKHLSNFNPILIIEPYDYAIVSCIELAVMPKDVIGKFGLTVSLFCQGIILSNGPQIDPGFNGTLFCLLFNTSNQPVQLKRGQHYATIEFVKMLEPAPTYKGKYQGKCHIIDYIPSNTLHGAINELKKQIEELKRESKLMQTIYLGVVALMFAVISIILVLK